MEVESFCGIGREVYEQLRKSKVLSTGNKIKRARNLICLYPKEGDISYGGPELIMELEMHGF